MRNRIHSTGYILTFLGLATSLSLSAQNLEGAQVVSGTIGAFFYNRNENYKRYNEDRRRRTDDYYSVVTHVSYGRVNHKNLLVSYGVAATFDYSKDVEKHGPDTSLYAKGKTFMLSPTLTLQKYVALSSRLYYTPVFNVHIGYGWHNGIIHNVTLDRFKSKTVSVGADFKPLGLTYVAKPNLFLSFGLGNASLDYSNLKTKLSMESGFEKERGTYNTFSFRAFDNYFSIGIQKILSAAK